MTTPAIALAAAVSGDARSVRPPRPWRPSKLRLLVLTAYCPGESWSPFMAMHIEQPDSRHSAPAARKTSWSPSRSAWAFTCWLPGTTMRRTPSAAWRPSRAAAAWRRSLIRELVQLPMKTTSTGWPAIGWPACRPMYSSARSRARRADGSAASSGRGTRPLTGMPMPGFVPQVIIGSRVFASSVIEVSNAAPSSVGSVRHPATAASHAVPCGAWRRPWTYSKVVSSGATRPARAPPSMLMLQIVIRCSIESARIASPRYSKTWPVPPPIPIRAMRARMTSLAPTPGRSRPSTRTS